MDVSQFKKLSAQYRAWTAVAALMLLLIISMSILSYNSSTKFLTSQEIIVLAILASGTVTLTLFILIRQSEERMKSEAAVRNLNEELQKKISQLELLNAELSAARDQSIVGILHDTDPLATTEQKVVDESADAAPPTFHSELILVAEDHPINQRAAQHFLNQAGFACHIVNNGKEAIDALVQENYALILMDCEMPELDGLSATGIIRKSESATGKHIPIVAVTAHEMTGDQEKCFSAGMDDYLTKPIQFEQLRAMLEKWLPSAVETNTNQSELPVSSAVISMEEPNDPVDLEAVLFRYGRTTGEKVLGTFLEDSKEHFAKLEKTYNDGDHGAFLVSVHGFKGVCGAVCAENMREICVDLEFATREASGWSRVNTLLDGLKTELYEATIFLQSKLSELEHNK